MTKRGFKLRTKLHILPTSPANWQESWQKVQHACSEIGTTPGVIKVPKGAGWIRVKNLFSIQYECWLDYDWLYNRLGQIVSKIWNWALTGCGEAILPKKLGRKQKNIFLHIWHANLHGFFKFLQAFWSPNF